MSSSYNSYSQSTPNTTLTSMYNYNYIRNPITWWAYASQLHVIWQFVHGFQWRFIISCQLSTDIKLRHSFDCVARKSGYGTHPRYLQYLHVYQLQVFATQQSFVLTFRETTISDDGVAARLGGIKGSVDSLRPDRLDSSIKSQQLLTWYHTFPYLTVVVVSKTFVLLLIEVPSSDVDQAIGFFAKKAESFLIIQSQVHKFYFFEMGKKFTI